MYVNKNLPLRTMMQMGGIHLVWIMAFTSLVLYLFNYLEASWICVPWTAFTVVGTAVSFYIGFKNNQAYDRLWEARKIWGAITNTSRMWGSNLRGFITPQFTDKSVSDEHINGIVKKLIYRHIAYLYALRSQLLVPAPWEHVSLNSRVASVNRNRMKTSGVGMFEYDHYLVLDKHLEKEEHQKLPGVANIPTQIIDIQSQHLKQLRKENLIDDFRHIELQKLLNDLYTSQGQAERIKKFPLPRQYGNASRIFVSIFIFLLPFGLIAEFEKCGEFGIWLFVPVVSIIAWIFLMMELVGDYSENPFEGLGNDVPMLSICRNIEIDLKQMIQDSEVPEPIKAKNGVLM
jgi:putative membrane protein